MGTNSIPNWELVLFGIAKYWSVILWLAKKEIEKIWGLVHSGSFYEVICCILDKQNIKYIMKQASILYKMHQCECYFDDSKNGGIFNAIKVTCQMLNHENLYDLFWIFTQKLYIEPFRPLKPNQNHFFLQNVLEI